MLSHHNKHWFRGPIGGTCLSTCLRLLQYLMEITPVLGRDYCSTCLRLLQYLGQVLSHTIFILLAKIRNRQYFGEVINNKGWLYWVLEDGARRPSSYYDYHRPTKVCASISRTVVSVPRPPDIRNKQYYGRGYQHGEVINNKGWLYWGWRTGRGDPRPTKVCSSSYND